MKRLYTFLKGLGAASVITVTTSALALVLSCSAPRNNSTSQARPCEHTSKLREILTDSISQITEECPGEIGVAIIINNCDTVTVNNRSIYPMMSVFKLYQALAVCHRLDQQRSSLDSAMSVLRDELDPHTWSPMLKDHPEELITLSVGDLLRYTLIHSDNNASNLLFHRMVDVNATDSCVARLIPRDSFRIAYTEAEMSKDHDRAYANYTSPLGAALLINRLFNDSLVSQEKQTFIRTALAECVTGIDRLAAPLDGKPGVTLAHKTGSGYVSAEGVLAAHNDIGFVTLPDGTHYAIAVFVKDFHGNESAASRYIARISATVYHILTTRDPYLHSKKIN